MNTAGRQTQPYVPAAHQPLAGPRRPSLQRHAEQTSIKHIEAPPIFQLFPSNVRYFDSENTKAARSTWATGENLDWVRNFGTSSLLPLND